MDIWMLVAQAHLLQLKNLSNILTHYVNVVLSHTAFA
jgi:hypothetical protein